MRIFVVENHADTLQFLRRYLEKQGHTVMTATTKSEALEAADGCACDVLISDVGLSDGDGWEVLQEARFSHPVFAISMSGNGMSNDAEKSASAGFRCHMRKPFELEQLDHLLEEAARESGGPGWAG
jgi:DNA-binding response OmpR family regulator